MITKRDIAVKWTAYGIASLFLILLHTFLLHDVHIWGVVPFLPPLLVGCIAATEQYKSAAIYAICLGFLCDITLSAPFFGICTIALTAGALVSYLLAAQVFPDTFFGRLLSSASALAVFSLFCCVTLLIKGQSLWPLLYMAFRELSVSLLLFPFVYPVLIFVHNRTTL